MKIGSVMCGTDRYGECGLGDSDAFVPDCGGGILDKKVDRERTI